MGQGTIADEAEMYSEELRLPVLPDAAPPLCEGEGGGAVLLPSQRAAELPSEEPEHQHPSQLSLQYHDGVKLRLRMGPGRQKRWHPEQGSKRCGLRYFGNTYELFRIDLRAPPMHRLGAAAGELQFWHRHWGADRNSTAVERVVLSVILGDAGGYLPAGVDRSGSRSTTLALLQSSESSPRVSAPLKRLMTGVRHGHMYTYHQTANGVVPCRSPVDWVLFREKVTLSGEESGLVAAAADGAPNLRSQQLSSVQLTCRDSQFRVLEVYPAQR